MRWGVVRVFSDRASRPRAIIWTSVALLGLIVLAAVAIVGTSTNWFCTVPCHSVHADNTTAFNASSHEMLSCVACHEPVNGDPLTFLLMKIEVAPDLIPTILGTAEFPLNEFNHVALKMGDRYCVQCHNLNTRKVNPSEGIIIDHAVHTENGVTCTTCHNRVAHPEENIEYTIEGNEKHDNWLMMEACFRCHTQDEKSAFTKPAPGECSTCHPADFKLVPADHLAPGWYTEYGDSKGHAAAAKEEASRAAEVKARLEEERPEFEHAAGPVLPPSSTIGSCGTCHADSFCSGCHGAPIPHPEDFVKTHGDEGRKNATACARCHAASAAESKDLIFCNNCHHENAEAGRPWLDQHDDKVAETGAQACFKCHKPTYCAACHVGGIEHAREVSGD